MRTALATLRHRGPDDSGLWSERRPDVCVDLAFARLAVLDLSLNGHQPMGSADGLVQLVYNGEIYNYRSLRDELTGLGHVFRSTSDSEVLLRGYEQFGTDVLSRIHGMFAFAIWDGRIEQLFAAVDRIGVKPLFWSDTDGHFAFASEIKGLLTQGIPRDIDHEALYDYFRYLYVFPPRTAFRHIRRLLPGQMLFWRKGRVTLDRYWRVPRPSRKGSTDEIVAELRPLLDQVVREQMVSDVPVGAFLSGGIDSSTLVALMARHSDRPVRTYCMTFGAGEELFDERAHARAVAEHIGTEHTEIAVEPKLAETLPSLVRQFDEPFGNTTALLLYALCREVRKHVTVAIAGDGGDELFLGYPRYPGMRLAGWYSAVPKPVRALLARALAPVLRESTAGRHNFRRVREFVETGGLDKSEMYDRWSGYYTPEELTGLLRFDAQPFVRADGQEPVASLFDQATGTDVDRANHVDLETFLPHNILQCTDRTSMAHSLEVRVPFCDDRLVEFMAQIPADQKMPGLRTKFLLKRVASDLLPSRTLQRKKQGFVAPVGRWLNRELRGLVDEMLDPARVRRDGFLDPTTVAELVAAHRSGRRDYSLHLWGLLVFQTWLDEYGVRITSQAA